MSILSIIMLEFVFFASYILFYNIYKKINVTKWINKNPKRGLVAFSITFAICLIAVVVIRMIFTDQTQQLIVSAAFFGMSAGILPHVYSSLKK